MIETKIFGQKIIGVNGNGYPDFDTFSNTAQLLSYVSMLQRSAGYSESTSFKVTSAGGMSVFVGAGVFVLGSIVIQSGSAVELSIDNTAKRTAAVVIRLTTENNTCTADVGVIYGEGVRKPDPVTDGNVYEQVIAYIDCKGAGAITEADITDVRYNKAEIPGGGGSGGGDYDALAGVVYANKAKIEAIDGRVTTLEQTTFEEATTADIDKLFEEGGDIGPNGVPYAGTADIDKLFEEGGDIGPNGVPYAGTADIDKLFV